MKLFAACRNATLLYMLLLFGTMHCFVADALIEGELLQWHKISLTVAGPQASEEGTPNPFLDYRMQVTFEHPQSKTTHHVPGYFAADGEAANTSASSGNKWRAHLSPDHVGTWTWRVSFRAGSDVAISDQVDGGTPVAEVDGLAGEFEIAATNKRGAIFVPKAG